MAFLIHPAHRARAAALSVSLLALACLTACVGATHEASANLPEIRLSERNRVPACVTPERLMAFARARNGSIDPRWRNIASYYKSHGEHWRVRWDYAFFQMLIETNYLSYRRPDGSMADVHPRQNNFAGLGAVGGVPGDSFPTPSTGVLAQIQHLVVYSGERLDHPTAPRTRLKMDEILSKSQALGRAVTFQDLAGRWAIDRGYGRSIEWTAQAFHQSYCSGAQVASVGNLPGRQRISGDGPRPDRTSLSPRETPAAREAESVQRAGPSSRTASRDSDPDVSRPKQSSAPGSSPTPAAPASSSDPAKPTQAIVQRTLPAAPAPMIKAKPPAADTTEPARTAGVAPTPPPAPPASPSPTAAAPSEAVAAAPAGVATAPGADTTVATTAVATAPGPTPPAAAAPATPCKIFRASYGGPKTLLIQSQGDGVINYTLLEVVAGREQDQAKAFMDLHAKGGKILGDYPGEADALTKTFELCPSG